MRLHGQAVKTSPFHGGNPGSIPGGVTKKGTRNWVPFLVTPPFISPVFKVSYFCGNVICGTRIVCTVQKKKLPFSHKISSTRQKQKTGSKYAPRQIFYIL